jgi:hypothetical protein
VRRSSEAIGGTQISKKQLFIIDAAVEILSNGVLGTKMEGDPENWLKRCIIRISTMQIKAQCALGHIAARELCVSLNTVD